MSLEILRQIRDASWFPQERLHVPLHQHLRGIADRFLLLAGRRAALRTDGAPAELAAAWRWVSLSLPPDLLIASLCSSVADPPDDGVLLVPPRLAELLRNPCAETHLHVGAGIPFGLLWAALMRDIAPGPTLKLKGSSGKPPFGSADAFTAHLLVAAITRLLLASFLRHREQAGDERPFREFIDIRLPTIAGDLRWGLGAHEGSRGLLWALRFLERRVTVSPPLERTRRLYQALAGRAPGPERPTSIEQVVNRDPLSSWLSWRPGLALPETRFTSRALHYLEEHEDEHFARVFWQYQRIRCLTHAFLVEEPGTAGLDWFTRHYARISPLRGTLTNLTYASALALQSRDLDLGALEARTAPETAWIKVRDEVRMLASAARRFRPLPGRERPEVGLVLHFIKEMAKGNRLLADPRHRAFGCRFGPWYHERQQQAMAIEAALHHHPELLLVLRG
ncbi:MAG: hypothetical protein U0359_14655, partial [Byssovorax sp.]